MNVASFPILSCIIVLPLLGAIACGFSRHENVAKWIALSIASLELAATLAVVCLFNAEDGNLFQQVEQYAWIPYLNVEYSVGIDGIALLFLPMSALVTLMSIAATWNSVKRMTRLHLALLLALESVTMGVFLATDLVLFFLFWELTLPPIFFLIGLWGIGPERRSAAIKYTLFMMFSGVPILFAFIILAINHANHLNGIIPRDLTFDLQSLLDTPLPENLQTIVFLLLLSGFAVKAPLVPFHTWLPSSAMEGPTHMTAILTGLKLGVFGIIRFALPLAPSAAVAYSWALGIFGAITLIYSALIALQQTNLRRLLAYASISHVGLVIVGIASLNMQGLQGALFQLFNFTVVASSMMLVAGCIHYRLGSTDAIHLGGLAKVMPKLTFFYFLFMLAGIGIPGTNGFPAELLIVISALLTHPSLGIAALAGGVLGAAYMLNFTRKAFFGAISHVAVNQAQDLRPREFAMLSLPALIVLFFGIFPGVMLQYNAVAAEGWLTHLLDQPIIENSSTVKAK